MPDEPVKQQPEKFTWARMQALLLEYHATMHKAHCKVWELFSRSAQQGGKKK